MVFFFVRSDLLNFVRHSTNNWSGIGAFYICSSAFLLHLEFFKPYFSFAPILGLLFWSRSILFFFASKFKASFLEALNKSSHMLQISPSKVGAHENYLFIYSNFFRNRSIFSSFSYRNLAMIMTITVFSLLGHKSK